MLATELVEHEKSLRMKDKITSVLLRLIFL